MAKVLIVDDEEVYRRQLEIALTPDGHEIKTASHGREAIDLATRYRPDVLVTDWMLKNHIHGVHVAHTVHSVLPDVQVIMITGFPSQDLRAEAGDVGIIDFIEKPFGLDRMRAAIKDAAAHREVHQDENALSMLEVDSTGAILFANSAARELLAETRAGPDAASLADVFSAEDIPELDAAQDRWIAAAPLSEQTTFWHLRSQPPGPGGSRLIILRRQDEPLHLGHTLVEMLLGVTEPRQAGWPFVGRVLVLDDGPLIRRTFVGMLESSGAGCYAAANLGEALLLIENDAGIQYVILDYDMPNCDASEAIEKIKAARPQVVIVGTSAVDHRDHFAGLGVEHFLQKPWLGVDLINTLSGRIGNCVECGLPLPLRRPKPAEEASRWVCAFCGSHYRAMFDDDMPHDTLHNVRPTAEN